MNLFRLYLWREWREHRAALVALALVLPLATALVAWPLAKGHVRDPYFHAAVAGGFALALLAVVGGAIHGLCGDGFGRGLRRGFDLAVPLDERDDLRPWGLLPVVGCALAANGAAGWILARRPDRVRPGPAPAPGRDR